ncbi:coil containing protein [Vibrio phage LP.2]|nr:coil containing protein [Vibrio phage LP.2]
MHYYKFNVASWAKDTSHLSLKEEGIYLRLINYYYDTEKPIPLKTHLVLRKLRVADESEAVDLILEEFFTKTKDGWIHNHCDKLINEYQKMAERNKKNAKLGGRPKNKGLGKPSGIPDGNQEETNTKPTGIPNQEPLTINQELETKDNDLLSDKSDAITILTYLNEVFSSRYKHTTKSHIENINARLAEGHTIEDCKAVIDHKFTEWGNDAKMSQYLRPQTLFQTGKFQGYLMAAKAKPAQSKHDLSGIEYQTGSF